MITLNETQQAEIADALDMAKQMADVADDWGLPEVEIDGEMVETRSLIDVFQAALRHLAEAGKKS